MQKGGALRTLGSKIGVGVNVAGMVGTGIKAISDRVKAKKAEKKEKQAALDKKQKGGVTPTKGKESVKNFTRRHSPMSPDFNQEPGRGLLNKDDKYNKIREDIEKTTGKKSSLKYQKGGGVQKIVGMPGYNAKTNTMKKGGSTSFGMLSVKAGVDKNPKPTAADRIVGAKKKMQKGGVSPSMMRTMKELDKKRKIGPGVPPPKDAIKNAPDAIKIPKPSFESKPMTYSDRKKLEEKNKGGSTKRK
jgi:hypothetical protein